MEISQLARQRMLALALPFGLAAIYYGTAKLGMLVALPIPPGNVTPIWFPAPIAWIGIFWFGYRMIPAIWLGDLLASTPSFYQASQNWGVAIVVGAICAASPALEAVLGNFLMQRLIPMGHFFSSINHVLKFALIAALSPAVNATIGVTTFCIFGMSGWSDFGSVWLTWWIGNMISLIVLLPMFLAWDEVSKGRSRMGQLIEMLLMLALLFGISKFAFWMAYPVEYLLIPCLIWATFRLGPRGATTSVVVVVMLAIFGTVYGKSSFMRASLNESLLLLQTFMGTVAITTLVLTAVLSQQRQSEAALATANQELGLRVEERTAAFEQLQSQQRQLEETLQALKQAQTQLVQTEKMSSLGQLVAGIAHEINNPVNFIAGNLLHLEAYCQDVMALIECEQAGDGQQFAALAAEFDLEFLKADLPKVLGSMKLGTDRIQRIVTSLRNFSRMDEAEVKAVDIHEGIDSTLLILQHRLKATCDRAAIQLIRRYGDLPPVECYVGQMNQVFMNILANAIDALEEGMKRGQIESPTITITTEKRHDAVAIGIADNGIGIPNSAKTKLFDPFYTTKPIGKGTGLGLAISYQIVTEKHHGKLYCDSQPNQGTEFWIEIPVHQQLDK
ncbi:MASE1 domain-containing protein [Leptolyngbya sp. NK1-12]